VSSSKKLVLDANILLRAVFGARVRDLLASHQETIEFYTPDLCVTEALRHIPSIARHRQLDPEKSEEDLRRILRLCVIVVDQSLCEEFEDRALARIAMRDPSDWPVVATAMLLSAPIWTEDKGFFGIGIATWTSDKIEIYLRGA
jgi:predicted nucleic acid-binding protein